MSVDFTRIMKLQEKVKDLEAKISDLYVQVNKATAEIATMCTHPTYKSVYNDDEFGRRLADTYYCLTCKIELKDEKKYRSY